MKGREKRQEEGEGGAGRMNAMTMARNNRYVCRGVNGTLT